MVTDEQLVELLSTTMKLATDDVFPRPGLLGNAAVRRPRRISWPSPGGLAAALAASGAVAIAVLAVALLGHGRAPDAGGPIGLPSATTPPATTLAGLRSELGILRRSQRPADRLPAWQVAAAQLQRCSNCLTVGTLMPGQTRLLTTIRRSRADVSERARERIYLVLGTVPRSWRDSIASGWRQPGGSGAGLHLSLVGMTESRTPGSQPVDTLLNYTRQSMPAATLTPRDVLITSAETVGVVPDGVTRVRWELANPGQRRPAVVHPRLRGNVATAPWSRAPRSTRLLNEQWLVGATWYGADGRVVASFHQSLAGLDRGQPKPARPSTGRRTAG
jgi:hypothetical protein